MASLFPSSIYHSLDLICLLCRYSQQEEIKPKEVLKTKKKKHKEQLNRELSCLRNELQQVKDDCSKAQAEVQSLTLVIAKYEEITKDLDMITTKTVDLEVCLLYYLFIMLLIALKKKSSFNIGNLCLPKKRNFVIAASAYC